MTTPRENFDSWFVNVLESLYPHREVGFVILLTVFPLLERYLRQRAGIPSEDDRLNPIFFDQLRAIFTKLLDQDTAKRFWTICRNGLLHQGTFSEQRARYGNYAFASHDLSEAIIIDQGNFGVHPVLFAKRALERIRNDFATFEGAASKAPPLSTVGAYQFGSTQMIIGTGLPSTGGFTP
jgi:hypothetical protein